RRDDLRIRPTICPFQGAAASYPWGFEERRIGAISPRIRENLAPRGGLPPFHGRGAAPRGRSPVNHPPFLSKTKPCFAARARQSCATLLWLRSIASTLHHYQFELRPTPLANVADLPARVAEPVPRSVAFRRNRRRDRLFHRARDRPAGSLFGLRTNSHHDDRPRIGRSVDHAGGNEVLRRSVNAGRAQ